MHIHTLEHHVIRLRVSISDPPPSHIAPPSTALSTTKADLDNDSSTVITSRVPDPKPSKQGTDSTETATPSRVHFEDGVDRRLTLLFFQIHHQICLAPPVIGHHLKNNISLNILDELRGFFCCCFFGHFKKL